MATLGNKLDQLLLGEHEQARIPIAISIAPRESWIPCTRTHRVVLYCACSAQVFRFFLLVPKPAPKGRMGKALRKLSPKNWLNKPMLLARRLRFDPSLCNSIGVTLL